MSGVLRYEGIPFVARFGWYAGELTEKFLKSLAEKKLLAAKCPKCGYTVFPPRIRCVKCYTKMGEENLVELSGKGKVVSWSSVRVIPDGKGGFKEIDPVTIAAVKLDGSDSIIMLPIDAESVEEGMEVEIEWREERKGEIADIIGFKPAGVVE